MIFVTRVNKMGKAQERNFLQMAQLMRIWVNLCSKHEIWMMILRSFPHEANKKDLKDVLTFEISFSYLRKTLNLQLPYWLWFFNLKCFSLYFGIRWHKTLLMSFPCKSMKKKNAFGVKRGHQMNSFISRSPDKLLDKTNMHVSRPIGWYALIPMWNKKHGLNQYFDPCK